MSTATSIQSPGLGPGTSLSLTGRPFGGRTILTLLGDVFKSPQFWDGIKVFGVGAAIAGSKWVAESIWDSLKRLVLARAVFRGGDDTHQWVMHYLTRTGHWSTHARDVEILCKPGLTSESIEEEEDGGASGKGTLQRGTRGGGGGGNAVVLGLPKGVNMFPLESTSLHFIFEGKHVFAVRDRKLVGDSQWEETLNLSFLTWSSAVIRRFIAVAKLSYDEHQRGKVQIFTTDRYNYWSRHKSITKRLSDSVHLPVNVKETLLRDATHFIDEDTKLWYSDRGIRYSRGYLFYGVPGSGKTSLAHVLASELELPIYQCNLNANGMDDSKYQELMSTIPPGVIVVLEDVDAAFANRAPVSDTSTSANGTSTPSRSAGGASTPLMAGSASMMGLAAAPAPSSRVSMSCLLNAIDGIGASDSRILIMTTNHRHLLDDALIRPGRIDLQFEFKNADRTQMKELFVRWFAPLHGRRSNTATQKSASGSVQQEEEQERVIIDEKVHDNETKTLVTAPRRHNSAKTHDVVDIQRSADIFASNVPEYSCSIASLQGYLLTCSGKTHRQTAEDVKVWLSEQSS